MGTIYPGSLDCELLKNKKIVAIDPGKCDLIYCVDSDNKESNKFRYSQDQRRKETKIKKYNKITIEQPLKEKGVILTDKKGNIKTDSSLRDYERIPLGIDVEEYFEREVKPHLPESWIDKSKDTVGYEINFTKYFYQYKPLRSLSDLTKELLDLEKESDGLMNKLIG
mgnify:CR=1 FL=1